MNWRVIEEWLLARASEKTTWIGLISLLTSIGGFAIAPDQAMQITTVATGIAGVLVVAMKEKGSDK